uniref:Protein Z-dependent protease inhibitor-like n=1 Tax=Mastacembelus armatus TaxID=205130 RepID=A0A3Q3KY80_9TELE
TLSQPCQFLSALPLLIYLHVITISPSVEDLTNRNADFATRLFRAVASRTDDNVFLSPFTLCTGLVALLSITNGPTRDQLLQGLTLTGLDPQTLPGRSRFQILRSTILRGGGATNLQQSVTLLPAQSFGVSSFNLDLVQTKFGGKVQSVTYTAPQEAADTINRLIQEQTGGQVQDVSVCVSNKVFLSFSAMFSPSFNSSLSQDERFYVDKYHVVMVPMMFRSDKYFLAYDREMWSLQTSNHLGGVSYCGS